MMTPSHLHRRWRPSGLLVALLVLPAGLCAVVDSDNHPALYDYTAQTGTEAVFRTVFPLFGASPTVTWYRDGVALALADPTAELRVTAGADGNVHGTGYHVVAVGALKGDSTVYRFTSTTATLHVVAGDQVPAILTPAAGTVLDKYEFNPTGGDWTSFQVTARGQGLTWTYAGDNGFTAEFGFAQDLQVATFNTQGLQDATEVTVTVTDPAGRSASRTWQFANEAPITTPQTFTVYPGLTYEGRLTATDLDGDALTYTLTAPPSHGTLSLNPDGTFTYVAASRYVGGTSFDYAVSDGQASADGYATFSSKNPDINGDGIVDANDYAILNASFGQELP